MSFPTKETTYEYAQRYVTEFGFSVIPLSGKKPTIKWAEYQRRKPTEEELKEWFLNGDNHNVGIVTGKISGIVVVDFDTEKALEVAQEHNFPETPIVRTGRGCHFYFKYRDGIRNSQKMGNSIHLRGEGGYVVAPPSIHPKTQAEYEWIEAPWKVPFAELPQMVLEELQKVASSQRPLKELYNGVPVGERNTSLARLAGRWVAAGLSLEECFEIASMWNQRNNPPLDDKEVKKTVKSIFDRRYNKLDIPPPAFEVKDIPFGYEVFEPRTKLCFTVKRIHHDKDALKCYLEIKWEYKQGESRLIHSGNFNLYSSWATKELSKTLKELVPSLDQPPQFVEQLKQEIIRRHKHNPPVDVQTEKIPSYYPKFLLEPFILKDNINMIHAHGGTGKSLIACYFATQVAQEGHKVLYLDYENPTTTHTIRRLAQICPRLGVNRVFVKRPRARLVDGIEEIYEDVKQLEIDLVIVDSIAKAMVTDLNSAEAVSEFTTTLQQVPVTWLWVHHTTKLDPDQAYGSVFFYNDARNVWAVKKVESYSGGLRKTFIQLIHKKSNFTGLYSSRLFKVREGSNGTLIIEEQPLNDFTQADLILLSLSEGPKTKAELEKALPSINRNSLGVVLDRLKKRRKVEVKNGVWTIASEEMEEEGAS
jgi:hypothetical protein